MSLNVVEIQSLARAVRRDILEMSLHAGPNGGHIGGSLSCADILAVLYKEVMHHSPQRPDAPDRDRFFLSKGHVALAHYAVLAEMGYFPREELKGFEASGGSFPTHEVFCNEKGIEASGGSLGYGLSLGVGCALAGKKDGNTYRVFVLLGDGECNEGSVWEAAMSASRFRLDHLTAIVDVNGQSLDGFTRDIMPISDLESVFHGFGWDVRKVDGHDIEQLHAALSAVPQGRPVAVLAQTVKGKGIRSIEGKTGWHHAILSEEEYDTFLSELEETM